MPAGPLPLRPFRFAVQATGAASAGAWRQLARKVEALGYSTLCVPDHLDDQWGPLVALTVAAEATTNLVVGTLVLDNDFRHPAVLAKELATLDLVSEGRVEVGLGAGWKLADYDQAGLAYDPPATRVERLGESVAVLKALWADGQASLQGRHYAVSGLPGSPKPWSRPRPSIAIGGGSRRILALAAAEADIVGVNPSLAAGAVGPAVAASALPERFAERVGWIREVAGPRLAEIELQCLAFLAAVVPNAGEVRASVAPAFGITAEQAAEVPIVLVGTVDELCETIQLRRERYGLSYWVLHQDMVEAFAPVVSRLAGR